MESEAGKDTAGGIDGTLSVDVEEWFCAHNLSPPLLRKEWGTYERRAAASTRLLLDDLKVPISPLFTNSYAHYMCTCTFVEISVTLAKIIATLLPTLINAVRPYKKFLVDKVGNT